MSGADRAGKKTKQKDETDRRKAQRAEKEVSVFGTNRRLSPEELDGREAWWCAHYEQLKARGYLLRPRYSPEWVPSWKISKKDWVECEDGKRLGFAQIIDATRISDGEVVTLKRINHAVHPHEVAIAQYFSSHALASQAANHCVPIHDVLTLDDDNNMVIIVMPLLRPYTDPRFDTIGEGVACIRQLFEGLHYIHKHNVAHRDCMNRNIMLDPSELYPDSFHPMEISLNRDYSGLAKHFTRTQRPPKYYFIDFGISRRYDPSEANPREVPIWGGDKDVPEFQDSNEPCNPFPTDVFYIGNAIKKDFIQTKRGFEFMWPLVADMIQADPAKRPTMEEVVARFDSICRGLSSWKLRSRAVDDDEDVFELVARTTSHWTRRIGFVTRGVPAMPLQRRST
ncbi:kinase-like domain-containing protein [Melanogaster broomeanus]|nr:kinase-like domain-containing protein [Melanogaster broomeanus]